jgi:hypothetical protein
VVADRCAAGGDEDIGVDARKSIGQNVEPIGQDAEIDRLDRQIAEQRGEHRAVRFG